MVVCRDILVLYFVVWIWGVSLNRGGCWGCCCFFWVYWVGWGLVLCGVCCCWVYGFGWLLVSVIDCGVWFLEICDWSIVSLYLYGGSMRRGFCKLNLGFFVGVWLLNMCCL